MSAAPATLEIFTPSPAEELSRRLWAEYWARVDGDLRRFMFFPMVPERAPRACDVYQPAISLPLRCEL